MSPTEHQDAISQDNGKDSEDELKKVLQEWNMFTADINAKIQSELKKAEGDEEDEQDQESTQSSSEEEDSAGVISKRKQPAGDGNDSDTDTTSEQDEADVASGLKGFSTAMAGILARSVSGKKRTPILSEVWQEPAPPKPNKKPKLGRSAGTTCVHQPVHELDEARERRLKKIAQRGVIKLFKAVMSVRREADVRR